MVLSLLLPNRRMENGNILPREINVERWYKEFIRHRRHELQEPLHIVSESVVPIVWTSYPSYLAMQRWGISELSGVSKNPRSVHPNPTIFWVKLVCLKT